MLTFDEDTVVTTTFEVGDLVKVRELNDLWTNPSFVINYTPTMTIAHVSGFLVDYAWLGQQGKIVHIRDLPDHNMKIYVLEPGAQVPEEALILYSKNRACECGKEKFNFTEHMMFCPKYEDF